MAFTSVHSASAVRPCRPTTLPNVARTDGELDDRHSAVRRLGDAHLLRPIDEGARSDLDRGSHRAGHGCSTAGAAGAAAGGRCRAMSVRTVSDGRAPFDSQ